MHYYATINFNLNFNLKDLVMKKSLLSACLACILVPFVSYADDANKQSSAQNTSVDKAEDSDNSETSKSEDSKDEEAKTATKDKKAKSNEFISNRFYFSIGIGMGWGGHSEDMHQTAGFVPYSLSFGWSWMFNKWIGVRPYLSTDLRVGASYSTNDGTGNASSLSNVNSAEAAVGVNGGINVDALVNFYNNEDNWLRVGGVVGIGFAGGYGGFLGANNNSNTTGAASVDVGYGEFITLRANLGIRVVWLQKHGMEFIVRIPMAGWSSGKGASASGNVNTGTSSTGTTSGYLEGTTILFAYSRTL